MKKIILILISIFFLSSCEKPRIYIYEYHWKESRISNWNSYNFYVDDVLNQNIKDGLRVKVFEVENYICWGTPNDYLTYIYWRDFFDKCEWHPYKIKNDITTK